MMCSIKTIFQIPMQYVFFTFQTYTKRNVVVFRDRSEYKLDSYTLSEVQNLQTSRCGSFQRQYYSFSLEKKKRQFKCVFNHVQLCNSGLQPAKFPCPGDFLCKNTGVGCHFLLQGIFLTQGLNSYLPHWQVDSLPLSQ